MIIRACFFVLAGGVAAQHSRVPLDDVQCYALLIVGVLLALFKRGGMLAECGAGFVFGFAVFIYSGSAVVEARVAKKYAGDSLLTAVRIASFPKHSGGTTTFLVSPLDDQRIPPRSRVSWYESTETPKMGELWQFELRLQRPRGFSSPGAFDRETWLFRERIHATGYVVASHRNRRLGAGALKWSDSVRRHYLQRLHAQAGETPSAAILAAIVVGIRRGVSAEQWQQFSLTGTSHLMAISGLHVGMAATCAFFLLAVFLGLLRYAGNSLNVAIVFGALGACAYASVSGFGIPAIRASIMLSLAALMFVGRRELPVFDVLALAALSVYLLSPLSILAPGFALSFLAVMLLFWRAKHRSVTILGDRRHLRWLTKFRDLMELQVVLLLGLLPITAMAFHRFPLLAPVANLFAVPVFSLIIIPVALLGLLLGHFSANVSTITTAISLWSIDHIQRLTQWLATARFSDISVSVGDATAVLLLFIVALWAVLPRQWPGRWLALIAAMGVIAYHPKRPPLGCFETHVLDVGQGSAHIVQTRSKALVFDTGIAYRNGGSAARQVILPFLRRQGIEKIDWLVISHADLDHSGGAKVLIDTIPTDRLYVGEPLAQVDASSELCRRGDTWSVDGVQFRFLHPDVGTAASGNNRSCTLKVSAGPHAVLLTGDIEAYAERRMSSGNTDLDADVVIIPHHGSTTSSTREFVAATNAALAIASAGYANRWGFPREEVVERWWRAGARVLTTATSGTVSFRLCRQGGLTDVQEYRRAQSRFWRD